MEKGGRDYMDYIVGGAEQQETFNQPFLAKIEISHISTLSYCSASVLNPRFLLSAAHCICKPAQTAAADLCASEEVNLNDHMEWSVKIEKVGSFVDDPVVIMDDDDTGYYQSEGTIEYLDEDDDEYDMESDQLDSWRVEKLFFLPKRIALEMAAEKSYTGPYDFVLLRLEAALELGSLIRPICLPFLTKGPLPTSEKHVFVDTGVKGFIAGWAANLSSIPLKINQTFPTIVNNSNKK